jgi:hypothetical protein
MGLAWSYDPDSYAGGSVSSGRVSHAEKAKDHNPDNMEYPGPPGLGVVSATPPRKEP